MTVLTLNFSASRLISKPVLLFIASFLLISILPETAWSACEPFDKYPVLYTGGSDAMCIRRKTGSSCASDEVPVGKGHCAPGGVGDSVDRESDDEQQEQRRVSEPAPTPTPAQPPQEFYTQQPPNGNTNGFGGSYNNNNSANSNSCSRDGNPYDQIDPKTGFCVRRSTAPDVDLTVGRDDGVVSGPALSSFQSSLSNPSSAGNINELIDAYEEKYKNECSEVAKQTDECCGDPISCMMGVKKPNGVAGTLAQTALGALATFPSSSISQMCKYVGAASSASIGLNSAMAAKCQTAVSQCKKACKKPKEIEQDVSAISKVQDTDLRQALYGAKERIEKIQYEYDDDYELCISSDRKNMEVIKQAINSATGLALAKQCEEQTKRRGAGDDPYADLSNGECLGAAASTPYCVSLCNRPGNNPNCPIGSPGNGGGTGGSDGELSRNSLTDPNFAGLIDEDDTVQNPNFQDIQATKNGLAIPEGGGGGGGLGGGDGGGGGGGAAPGPGGGGDEGYNTDILNGTTSGNGYSSRGGARSGASGGFSGYGNSGSSNILGKPFDLKSFLPGDRSNVKKTTFRGLASNLIGIGPAHGDIFKKITDRFYQVCLRDALYDCNGVLKAKPRGR